MRDMLSAAWERFDFETMVLPYWKTIVAGFFIFMGILSGILVGKVWTEMAGQLWPWPLAFIFLGLGLLVRQNVLAIFGGIMLAVGVGVLII